MNKFTTFTSIVAPLAVKDVDTDMIIPAQYLTSISRDGFGPNLFARLRSGDAEFFMNKDRFKGAQILLSDSNFGCGSSREHAVWALTGGGFRVVIAKSFADIFANNSAKNGLLLVRLEESVVDSLLTEASSSTLELTVDLERQVVSASGGREWPFQYDPFLKYCMINGLDDLEHLRTQLDTIRAFKEKQSRNWFFDARTPNNDVR